MRSTIKDVSNKSGISVTTVSKYLNGVSVRKSSADKIETAIRALNYTVNQNARSLKTNRTMLIGIIIDSIGNTFYASLVSALGKILHTKNYSSIICETDNDPDNLKSKLNFLRDKNVDGILVLQPAIERTVLKDFLENYSEVVVIDTIIKNLNCDCVATDNITGTYYAIEQFILKGHKKIGVITGKPYFFSAKERLRGFKRAMKDYKIPINPKWIIEESYDIEGGYRAFKKLAASADKPTAVFIASYFMTIGSIILINEKSIGIPDDISIICFDNHELNRVFKPSLSYIEQPIGQISEIAVELLFRRINGISGDNSVLRVPPRLVIGASVSNIKN